ncbi:hypothetical protein KY290_010561 [Solanum tuberosum]|uniref:peptidylprolyl isomerase n=1 Tax=Solanum tuberosum TaxID=4113 RepID=A0ABQ7VY52_SOLTU|nr:hypothetical protein KY290_010561 [Solanum tuberosum]
MASIGTGTGEKNLNASQFYITLRDDLDSLDGEHTIFGEITKGFDTLNRINEAYLADLILDASPERKPKDEIDDDVRLEDDWMPNDEELGVREKKEAHSREVILESVGDIPEMEPPYNVLYVRKLNPSTEEEALYIIFSHFGIVTSAEIIRDHKTGDSHCYAFIEFKDKESCEQAYFKMDNTQIDYRRIRVDFSQCVAKLWSQFRPTKRQWPFQ